MVAKVSYKTVAGEINRLLCLATWGDDGRATVLGYSMERKTGARPWWDIVYRGGDDPKNSAHGLVERIYFLIDVPDTGDLVVIKEEVGHRNGPSPSFRWNSTTWFYKHVERSIELKREQQELARACKKLPEGVEKQKPRRL